MTVKNSGEFFRINEHISCKMEILELSEFFILNILYATESLSPT